MILYIFSFLAGIATVLSPCVLPLLPIILSTGIDKQRFRPLVIILGFILSFSFFTLALAYLVHSLGLSANLLRYTAIFIIAIFGLIMLFPKLNERYLKATSFIGDAGTKLQSTKTQMPFFNSLLLGVALGLVWTPCAGPILAVVTSLAATRQVTQDIIFLTLFYSLGCGIPMLLIAYGGNKLFSVSFFTKHGEAIKKIFGGLIILTAVALFFHAEVYLQQWAIEYLPTLQIENNPQVERGLRQYRQGSSFENGKTAAPDFSGITKWINSQPLKIEELRGKLVLIDFWTYSCINCIRTFPYLKKWYDEYKDKGFVIIGVHTPEFEFEKDSSNVEKAVKRFGITYPVAMDNDYKTWQAYSNHYWPAHYLIDQQGIVRFVHFGEGKYQETENAIRGMLGMAPLKENESTSLTRTLTPETYLGISRASQYANEIKPFVMMKYSYIPPLGENEIGLQGEWRVEQEHITSGNGTLDLNFIATKVYLVMAAEELKQVTVLLDGKPLLKEFYTQDMDSEGNISVKDARKYDIVDLKGKYGRHTLSLIVPEKVSAYAFTFGDE